MEGSIELVAFTDGQGNDGIRVRANIKDVGLPQKTALVDALLRSLRVESSSPEFMLIMLGLTHDTVDASVVTEEEFYNKYFEDRSSTNEN